MGSLQFQEDYISHLQQENTTLKNKLCSLKDCYDKILNIDYEKSLQGVMADVMHVLSVLPADIDSLFEKLCTTMNQLKDILIKKSEMVRLANLLSDILQPTEQIDPGLDLLHASNVACYAKRASKNLTNGKGGTAKVSPMIKGHVISTGPRIHLNRVSQPQITRSRIVSESPTLSPIAESSPTTPAQQRYNCRELRIPLQRLEVNQYTPSPKTSFSKKKRSSPRLRKSGLSIIASPEVSTPRSLRRSNIPQTSIEEVVVEERAESPPEEPERQEEDPLEGPSWLLDRRTKKKGSSLESALAINGSPSFKFVTTRRPKCSSLPSSARKSSRIEKMEPISEKNESDKESLDDDGGSPNVTVNLERFSPPNSVTQKGLDLSDLHESATEENEETGVEMTETNLTETEQDGESFIVDESLTTSDMEITNILPALEETVKATDLVPIGEETENILESTTHSETTQALSPKRTFVEESDSDSTLVPAINVNSDTSETAFGSTGSSDKEISTQNSAIENTSDKNNADEDVNSSNMLSIPSPLTNHSEDEISSPTENSRDNSDRLDDVGTSFFDLKVSPIQRSKRKAALECMRQKCWLAESPTQENKCKKEKGRNRNKKKDKVNVNSSHVNKKFEREEDESSEISTTETRVIDSSRDITSNESAQSINSTLRRNEEFELSSNSDSGRRKRRAAPNCLKEPKLNNKLRRN